MTEIIQVNKKELISRLEESERKYKQCYDELISVSVDKEELIMTIDDLKNIINSNNEKYNELKNRCNDLENEIIKQRQCHNELVSVLEKKEKLVTALKKEEKIIATMDNLKNLLDCGNKKYNELKNQRDVLENKIKIYLSE